MSEAKQAIYECNACDWMGRFSNTCMLGDIGPLCPKCRETVALAALSAEQPEPVAWRYREYDHEEKAHSPVWLVTAKRDDMLIYQRHGAIIEPLYVSPIAAPASQPDELESMTRMFHAACADLGQINEALGLDPDDGGAEPILDAIEELKAKASQPDAAAIRRKALEEIKAKLKHRFLGYEDESVPLSTVFDCLDSLAQAPQEQQEREAQTDLEARDRVAKALGLEAGCTVGGKRISFAWEYLLGLIEDCVAACESTVPVAQQAGQPAPADHWRELAEERFREIKRAQAIIDELRLEREKWLTAPAVPEGCVIVPKEPTQEMLDAWLKNCNGGHVEDCETGAAFYYDAYRTMINAAPAQEGEKK